MRYRDLFDILDVYYDSMCSIWNVSQQQHDFMICNQREHSTYLRLASPFLQTCLSCCCYNFISILMFSNIACILSQSRQGFLIAIPLLFALHQRFRDRAAQTLLQHLFPFQIRKYIIGRITVTTGFKFQTSSRFIVFTLSQNSVYCCWILSASSPSCDTVYRMNRTLIIHDKAYIDQHKYCSTRAKELRPNSYVVFDWLFLEHMLVIVQIATAAVSSTLHPMQNTSPIVRSANPAVFREILDGADTNSCS